MDGIAAFRPNVLVSDIAMAEEDGYSLARRLRRLASADGGSTPAIAVSAYAREDDRIRSLAAGFQQHIAKPLDPEELVAAVNRLAHRASDAPAPDATGAAARPAAPGNGNGAASRVLVVEDDADSREGLRNLLEVWGHDVIVAENGISGIEKAIEGRPDIALIDVGLPGLDGYAVALRLRELLGNDEIFLIALTGYAEPEDRLRALESGFHAHLPKPINYSRLSSLLAERNRRGVPQPDSQPKTAG
jgi:CheY-like chemotaxis protein